MDKNSFLVLRDIYAHKHETIREIAKSVNLSLGLVHSTKNILLENGYIDSNSSITKKGIDKLEEYRVKSAIILAAGLSTRFAPLSFDKPKGLLEVNGEILIERQIRQLKEAGIETIVLVLGYKKESFFYLGEKYDTKIIINSFYDSKNNSYSAYLASNYFQNSYICSSDSYFVNNPFNLYEYESYVLSENVKEISYGSFLKTGSKEKVLGREKGNNKGLLYKGLMYWNKEFGNSIKEFLDKHINLGDVDQDSINTVVFDNLAKFPPIYSLEKESGTIFRFYSLKELTKYDEKYIENVSSTIMKNIARTLKCKEKEIESFLPIKEGLTNTSYTFIVKGKKYVYRHPGNGTEKIINRINEKKSLEKAKELGIDPTYIKMDARSGWKISEYLPNCREPDYNNFEDSKLIISKMKELHSKNVQVDWKFSPWEDALKMESIIRKKSNIEMTDFDELKSSIYRIYNEVNKDGLVNKCFCHCDTYKPNWLINDKTKEVVLIDWEYSGNADPGVDVGYYIVDAMYKPTEAVRFVKEYLKDNYSYELEKHYMAYIAIIAYYWFVWALYREVCSAVMGESLYNWYYMAKKYSKYVLRNYFNEKTNI